MAKQDSNLSKTCNEMKNVLAETIDDLTEVVKKSSKGLFKTILERGSENVGDLLDVYSAKLKKKVTDGEKRPNKNQ